MERSTVQSCLAAPFFGFQRWPFVASLRSTHSRRSRDARGILKTFGLSQLKVAREQCIPRLTIIVPRWDRRLCRQSKTLRRLFIAASRIPTHAFARQSWPGLELFVIVSRCERIELERTATRPRHRIA